MVQVLTHMKEKATFVAKQNTGLRAELEGLESELAAKRDSLTGLKARRDGMRAAGARMRDACTYVTSPLLLADFAVGCCALGCVGFAVRAHHLCIQISFTSSADQAQIPIIHLSSAVIQALKEQREDLQAQIEDLNRQYVALTAPRATSGSRASSKGAALPAGGGTPPLGGSWLGTPGRQSGSM
jgi:hypothetical protein